jgi:hypothetical protein
MSAATNIFGYEKILATALQAVLTTSGLTALTIFDTLDFQKQRPCVAINTVIGQGHGRFKLVNGRFVESAWRAQYVLQIVTAADASAHSDYLAEVRASVWGMLNSINETSPMSRHAIAMQFRDAGTATDWTPEDGLYSSRWTVDFDFSVQDDAWAELAT